MLYSKGYKYQLRRDEFFKVDIHPPCFIENDFSELYPNGSLIIRKGYAWDGASGPAIDTEDFMRGSLAHDALYQFIGNNQLDIKWREQADKELIKFCKEDGMPAFRRWYVHLAVNIFGKSMLRSDKEKEV